jgi:hypothetical protein
LQSFSGSRSPLRKLDDELRKYDREGVLTIG